MIALNIPNPSAQTLTRLSLYQKVVDRSDSYVEQVDKAKSQFALANTKSNPVFREVRAVLASYCSGARRCMYCEDSVADEVEHHHPKTLYPSMTFRWENYLYACGPCNGPKNSKFAVIANGSLVIVTRPPGAPVHPPIAGTSALIEPRREDPLHFLFLDIRGGTFRFTPHPDANSLNQERAAYTIDVLGLNSKDWLVVARREAYHSYLARLRQYEQAKGNPDYFPTLQFQKAALLRMQHPTVFREMLRQAQVLQPMASILVSIPEVLQW